MPEASFFTSDAATLTARGALWTAQEIRQQPAALQRTNELLLARRAEIEAFLTPLLKRPDLRVILTGAGTSAFIGESLAPWLSAQSVARIDAIATTDLVSAPDLYFKRFVPTLLVSFGRSGASPESLAAIELAESRVSEIHHLIITCNADGALAAFAGRVRSGFGVILPEETHDRGFAMTSSYMCMTYAALAMLGGLDAMRKRIGAVAAATQAVIDDRDGVLRELSDMDYDRVVYLGSHALKGAAREASLKLMELTDGAIATLFDSPLGVRHGPKTFVNARTLVVVFLSNHPYTRQYDLDLVGELRRDGAAARVTAFSAQPAEGDVLRIPGMAQAEDIDLIFPYIAAAQIFALQQSLRRGLTPDQPNAQGMVNRVVQGVRIYEPAL